MKTPQYDIVTTIDLDFYGCNLLEVLEYNDEEGNTVKPSLTDDYTKPNPEYDFTRCELYLQREDLSPDRVDQITGVLEVLLKIKAPEDFVSDGENNTDSLCAKLTEYGKREAEVLDFTVSDRVFNVFETLLALVGREFSDGVSKEDVLQCVNSLDINNISVSSDVINLTPQDLSVYYEMLEVESIKESVTYLSAMGVNVEESLLKSLTMQVENGEDKPNA